MMADVVMQSVEYNVCTQKSSTYNQMTQPRWCKLGLGGWGGGGGGCCAHLRSLLSVSQEGCLSLGSKHSSTSFLCRI